MPSRPAPPPTRIFVARHGQTVSNREGLFCGHSETPLTGTGRDQARALALRLREIPIHAAYASDFSRARDTASAVLEGRSLPLVEDPALRELHYGQWEMEKERLIARRYPQQFRLMRAEDPSWRPPGGEDIQAVRARTYAALRAIARRHPHQNTLIVSHGTAINCMLSAVLGMPASHTFRFAVDNCGLSEVTVRGGRLCLSLLNDTSHLQRPPPP